MKSIITFITFLWLATLFVSASKVNKNGWTTKCEMSPKCPKGWLEDGKRLCNKWEKKIHCVKGIDKDGLTPCVMTMDPPCPKGYVRDKVIICNKWERKAHCVKKN
ncbi:hypothetical protein BJ944DRAFT_272199 [Cunninghamella echinulata]|nr:hypothetical protein BJ944DRAFT_272199 [Cunninghamella echinulata]